jgi:hypothetical protein
MTKRKSPTATAKFTMTMVVAVVALCVMTIMMGMGNRMQQYQPTTNLAMTVVAKTQEQEDYTTNIETYKAEDSIHAMPFFKDIMERPADCPDLMWNSAQSARDELRQAAAPSTPIPSPGRWDHFAIAMIYTGGDTEHTNVERAVQSMRRRGLYEGRILVVTDATSHRYQALVEQDPQI